MDLGSQATGVAALADPTRRALYEYVVSRPEPVGREEAAAASAWPRTPPTSTSTGWSRPGCSTRSSAA